MHCPWCSNPESIPLSGCMMATDAKADALCPFGAVKNGVPDNSVCQSCEKPCLAAKRNFLKQSFSEHSTEDVLREIEKSRLMFFDGGGVTFTGGECTVQFDALSELLHALHERNIHTAIETNGYHPLLPELFPVIDYLIMDLKHWNSETHKNTVGLGNERTLQNIRKASENRSQLLVRIPLIGNFNDSEEDAVRFAQALSCLREGQAVEVLRYHEYGKDKWKQCGMHYTMHDADVSDEKYRNFCVTLQNSGLTLIHT